MNRQQITYQRDKDGNIKKVRVFAKSTDILREEFDKIVDVWYVIFDLIDEKTNKTIHIARYGKHAMPIKDMRKAIADLLSQGMTWHDAFYGAVRGIDIHANIDSDNEEYIHYDQHDITAIVMYAEERVLYRQK
jgi:hypothetical protein